MKIFLLIIFPALLLFPSCMMMHTGNGGMHGMRHDNHAHDHQIIHVMDDNFHIDIKVYRSEPPLFMFTITEAETGTPAQNITGKIIISDTNVSSELNADIREKGQYTAVLRLPEAEKNNITIFLTIGDKHNLQSTFDFSLVQEKHSQHQRSSQSGLNTTTTTILVGMGMGLMIIGMMLFRWF